MKKESVGNRESVPEPGDEDADPNIPGDRREPDSPQLSREEALEKLWGMLYRYLVGRLRMRHEDAEDIVQDTMVVLESRPSYRRITSVPELFWLARQIVRNKCLNLWSWRGRRKDWEPVGADHVPSDELSPDEDAIRLQLLTFVMETTEPCRTLLTYQLEGYRATEIVEKEKIRLGLRSANTVYIRIYHCYKRLRVRAGLPPDPKPAKRAKKEKE